MTTRGARGGMYNAWDNVAAAATDSVLVAANFGTGARIRVVGVFVNAGGAGTAISPTFKIPLNGGFVLPMEEGWFETNPGEALTITTAAASAIGVIVIWELAG
jgi:hypothetical protein